MVTKESISQSIDTMCSDPSVSLKNKGAFLLSLFMYPLVEQDFIMKHLLTAIKNKAPARSIVIISISQIKPSVFASKSDRNYRYLVKFEAECAMCKKDGVQESNIYGGHLSLMCSSCSNEVKSNIDNRRYD